MRELTKAELHHFETEMTCVACGGDLMGGPEGGLCKNFKCRDCARVWNLCFAMGSKKPTIFAGQLVQGDGYDPQEEVVDVEPQKEALGWGPAFAIAALILMGALLIVWVAMGGMDPGLAER